MGYTSTLQAVQFAPLVAREHTPSDVDKIVDHTISIPVFPTLRPLKYLHHLYSMFCPQDSLHLLLKNSSWVYGLPRLLSGKESVCQAGDAGLIPGSGRSLDQKMATHSNILPGKAHGQRSLRSLASCSPWGCQRVRHNLATSSTHMIYEI